MVSFAAPLAFLLLPLPLLVLYLMPPRPAHSAALVVPETVAARLAGHRRQFPGASARMLPPALIWIGLVAALAGPRTIATAPALPVSGREIVLALDLSGSMDRSDFVLDGAPAKRIDVLKKSAARFVRGRAGDRVGLVVFAETAYYAAAPTFDTEAVAAAIERATIGISGRSTAISEGLGLALKRLRESPASSRAVILLSDGVNNAGSVKPAEAAALARKLGIRVHTIAMGVRDLQGAGGDPDAVDAETLAAIAAASGGTAFRVRSAGDLDRVAAEIDAMEASPLDAPPVDLYRELWPWPAALAFFAVLALPLLRVRPA